MRNSNPPNTNRSTPSGFSGAGSINNVPSTPIGFNMNHPGGGYRGNRGGGYNNRGGGMGKMSNYNRGGFQLPLTGSFQGNAMNGFQAAPMSGMPSYGGFQNRGGMMGGMRGGQMGMRGGRGGMSQNSMMGMPMNGMGMAGMGAQMNGMSMGMPQMGAMGMQGTQYSHNYPDINISPQIYQEILGLLQSKQGSMSLPKCVALVHSKQGSDLAINNLFKDLLGPP